MDATKSLVITLPEGTPNGTIIRYSLDCSNVTEQSPVYNGTPIEINANTIVRARLFHDDYLSPFTQHKATYSIQGNSNSP
ncbi:MAG: chitobiase/beta-hexosaminidase C-terminal domain-containing protein [Muribaculaceae bacterium]